MSILAGCPYVNCIQELFFGKRIVCVEVSVERGTHCVCVCVCVQGLRANWTGLLLAVQRAKNETENQILIRDSKGLSEDQIKEYRQSFDHFDRVRAHLNLSSLLSISLLFSSESWLKKGPNARMQ